MATGTVTIPTETDPADPPLELAFLPLHKRALGTGMAAASAVLVFILTIVHLARTDDAYPLSLLESYFYGYEVSLTGAFIGAFWAAVGGFVAGWFFAFCRNLAIATSAFIVRTRAELQQLRDFLDHI